MSMSMLGLNIHLCNYNYEKALPEHKQQRTTGQMCIEVKEAAVDNSHFSLLSYDRPIGGTEGWV